MLARLYYVRCDRCGAPCGGTNDLTDSAAKARKTARRRGWKRHMGGLKVAVDLCPPCAEAVTR